MDGRRSPLLGGLTVALGASLFGMLGPLSRTVYGLGMTPYGFVAWRTGVGALVTGGLVLWRVRRSGARMVGWRSLDGRGRASLAVACLAGAALNMAMFLAFARVPIAIVLLCFYLYPAIVVAVSSLLGWERLDRPRVVALVISLGGMVAVVAGGSGSAGLGGPDPLGVALALSGALSQAVFVLVSRSGYRAVPTDQAMAVILGASGLAAAAAAVAGGIGGSILLPLTAPPMLGLLLFTGVFAAAIPSNLFLAGIRWIGPVRAGILMLIEPLVGVLLAALLLGESVGPVQVAGGLAILAGAVIIQRARPAEPTIVPAAEPETEAFDGPGTRAPLDAAAAPAMGPDR